MKKIIVFILVVLLSAPAFAKHKHKRKQQPTNSILSVSIHRSPCYGSCPEYTIEINNDGATVYTATRFVPDTGVFTKNIGPEKAMEIINQFIAYRVDTCNDMYKNRIPDLPGLVITIKYNDSTKTIRNAGFGPYYLKQLANSMDEVGKKTDDTWKKTSMPKTN